MTWGSIMSYKQNSQPTQLKSSFCNYLNWFTLQKQKMWHKTTLNFLPQAKPLELDPLSHFKIRKITSLILAPEQHALFTKATETKSCSNLELNILEIILSHYLWTCRHVLLKTWYKSRIQLFIHYLLPVFPLGQLNINASFCTIYIISNGSRKKFKNLQTSTWTHIYLMCI